jgi:Zn-dependent peptidase ImmA (M78 family)
MIYFEYSPNQLEEKAEGLLQQFDSDRLIQSKPIDVYAVIEKCLDVPYDWKYLTPDQTYLGMTAFRDGYIWVWPESRYYEGLKPKKLQVSKGMILIDATLTEEDNRGRENFTVMHEVFHQVLHKKCFRRISVTSNIYLHGTKKQTIDGQIHHSDYGLSVTERQANACAAAFLMPRDLTKETYSSIYRNAGSRRYNSDFVQETISEMAEEFQVSKQAMTIRLQTLKLINKDKESCFHEAINI